MKVILGISNRHVHLTYKDYSILFGCEELTKKVDLRQKGQFAAIQTVTIKTDKNSFDNVRIVGPFRNYTQVEISKTDSYTLGIKPPIRNSGDLIDSSLITIIGPNGSITKQCCIIPQRHIHIGREMLNKYGWKENDIKTVILPGLSGGVLFNVILNVSEETFFEIHLDTDEANAFNLKQDDILEIKD